MKNFDFGGMQILNYTPHTINIMDEEDNVIVKYPSIGIARCKKDTQVLGKINGVELTDTIFGKVEGLPEQKKGVLYIVSRIVRQALEDRDDLVVPNEQIKDDSGITIGCKSFSRR